MHLCPPDTPLSSKLFLFNVKSVQERRTDGQREGSGRWWVFGVSYDACLPFISNTLFLFLTHKITLIFKTKTFFWFLFLLPHPPLLSRAQTPMTGFTITNVHTAWRNVARLCLKNYVLLLFSSLQKRTDVVDQRIHQHDALYGSLFWHLWSWFTCLFEFMYEIFTISSTLHKHTDALMYGCAVLTRRTHGYVSVSIID